MTTKLKTKLIDKVVPANHVIVQARAGTGKTTTLIEGLKLLKGEKPGIEPSEQQQAVWDEILKSKGAKTVCFVAFNNSIADELKQRVPKGCDAMTIHSMGYKAINNAYGYYKPDKYRTRNLLEKVTGKDSRELFHKYPSEVQAVDKLVGLVKANLLDPNPDNLDQLCSEFNIETNGSTDKIYKYVEEIIELAKDPSSTGTIDFNDMIWLPVVNNLSLLQTYDLLLVDESQDLNRCQQELVLQAGCRLIFVGDDKQAIYGFAGADSTSITRLEKILSDTKQGCAMLKLTVTRRCSKSIVKEAQQFVSDFEAHESNGLGVVTCMTLDGPPFTTAVQDVEGGVKPHEVGYKYRVKDGDMILCRTNAPLIKECFALLRQGKKAIVRGRDIGMGLVSLIKKFKANTIEGLVTCIETWENTETAKERAKKNPSDTRLIAIQDKADCLRYFVEDAFTVEDVLNKIENIFSDTTTGVMLSSIHKAKGLEANHVFVLDVVKFPHPMAKTMAAKEQEYNLRYVQITRAKSSLVYVN